MKKSKHRQVGPTLFDMVDISLVEVQEKPNKTETVSKPKEHYDNKKIADKLFKIAMSLQNKADAINTNVNGNWTARRQRFADSAQQKKDTLLKHKVLFTTLSNLWLTDECPKILKGIRTVSDLDAYYPKPLDGTENDTWKEKHPKLLKKAEKMGLKSYDDNEVFKAAIKELSSIKLSKEEIKERKIAEALKSIRGQKIPGFFPTPPELIDKMIELANLDDRNSILEPSAGIGSICDRLIEQGHKGEITAVEIRPGLCDIIELKGHRCLCMDILAKSNNITHVWERILMNPPFEKAQDIDHVMYCYNNFLMPGGILVSVMSQGVIYNSTKKHKAFQEFVKSIHGEVFENGQAFKKAFNSTGTSSIIVKLVKS